MNNDIDDILRVLNNAKRDQEDRELQKRIGATVQMALYDRIYEESLKRNNQQNQQPKQYKQYKQTTINPKKSIRNPITPARKAKICSVIDEILDEIKKHPIATTLIGTAVTLGILMILPTLKANGQINELTTAYGNKIENDNYGEEQGIFSKIKLTINPSDFVSNMNLTSNSHMRLYILSTVIQDSDFDAILEALGYGGKENYINKLGFKHNQNLRASEQYSIEYEKKLRDLIKELNNNPDLIPQYIEKYPELRFIYDPNNTYLVEGHIYTTNDNGRSH